jgi:hypothetical protein
MSALPRCGKFLVSELLWSIGWRTTATVAAGIAASLALAAPAFAQPTAAPANLHQTGSTATTVTIAWDPTTDPSATGAFESLRPPVTPYGGGTIASAGMTSATFQYLACGSTYTANVYWHDSINTPGPTSSVNVTTTPCTKPAPPAPTGLKVTQVSGGQAQLSYDPPADASIVDEGVSLSGPSPAISPRPKTLAVSDGYTTYGVVCGESYTFTLAWINDEGSESPPATVAVNGAPCPDPAPGPAPSGMRTNYVEPTAIGLVWNDFNPPANVSGWRLLAQGGSVNTKTYGRSTGDDIRNLTCGTTYSFSFSWVFSDGTISQPATAAFATSACPVVAPTEPPADVTPPVVSLKSARLHLRGRPRRLSVPLACATGETTCAGTVKVSPKRRTVGRRRLPAVLARGGFSMAGGASTAVKMKVTRAVIRALSGRSSVAVVVTIAAHDSAGNSVVKRFSARLVI